MVIGLLARVVALRMGAPQLVVAVPAALILLPGLTIFRSMYVLTIEESEILLGAGGMLNAGAIVLGVAAGIVLGDTLATAADAEPGQQRAAPGRGADDNAARRRLGGCRSGCKICHLDLADGEFLLSLEVVLHPALGPVAGERHLARSKAALDEETSRRPFM